MNVKILFICCLLSMSPLFCNAQEPTLTRIDRMSEALDELELTTNQRNEMIALKEKYRDLFLHNYQSNTDPEVRRERRRVLQSDLRIELERILTPSQQDQFRKSIRDISGAQGHRRMFEVLAGLDLSLEQRREVKILLQNQRPKMDTIVQSDMPGNERRQALNELRQETNSMLLSILNKEQREIFKKEMPTGGRHTGRRGN